MSKQSTHNLDQLKTPIRTTTKKKRKKKSNERIHQKIYIFIRFVLIWRNELNCIGSVPYSALIDIFCCPLNSTIIINLSFLLKIFDLLFNSMTKFRIIVHSAWVSMDVHIYSSNLDLIDQLFTLFTQLFHRLFLIIFLKLSRFRKICMKK